MMVMCSGCAEVDVLLFFCDGDDVTVFLSEEEMKSDVISFDTKVAAYRPSSILTSASERYRCPIPSRVDPSVRMRRGVWGVDMGLV